MSKLQETRNFLSLYRHAAGISEVPEKFHYWCALSVLAACVGNNVWFEKFRGKPMFPNLYILLLGPSGAGKNTAINNALKLVENDPVVCLYRGKLTAAGMIDMLCKPSRDRSGWVHGSRMYYVTPELGMSVGTGPLADDWVKFMTEMYTGDTGEHSEATRTSGYHKLISPTINWLAGSTEDWLVKSISPDSIAGGFFARTVVVSQVFDPNNRCHIPLFPSDYQEVVDHLRMRAYYYARVRGQMYFSPEALELDQHWYYNRPAPEDEGLIAIWKREHDIVIKLAMLLCLADMVIWDGRLDFQIKKKHILGAQQLIQDARQDVSTVVRLGQQSRETIQQSAVENYIKKAGQIQHSNLLRKVSKYGIGTGLLKQLVQNLIDRNQVKKEIRGQAMWYIWRKRLMPDY